MKRMERIAIIVSLGLTTATPAIAVQLEAMSQMIPLQQRSGRELTSQPFNMSQAMPSFADQLANTEWLLEDLNGSGVVDRLQTTLRFDGTSRISGQGGCNRYFAQVQIKGDRLAIDTIGSTRKLCSPAVMDQETRYFKALESARQIRFEGPYLLIGNLESAAPLRFTRLASTSMAELTLATAQGRRNTARVFQKNGQTQIVVVERRQTILNTHR